MFISNGMVYGDAPEIPVRLTAVKALQDRILILTFATGENRLFDATGLKGPVFEPLADQRVFETAAVDHGVVTWLNGEIDCSPEYLYEHSYEYSCEKSSVG